MLIIGGLLGGVLMILKMEKSKDAPAEKSTEEKKDIEQPTAPSEKQDSNDTSEEIIEDVESLRSVIKLDGNEGVTEVGEKSEGDKKKEEKSDDVDEPVEESDETRSNDSASARESLEQKRVLLQRIKDFDLQIKKNQQDINDVSEKINAISKDLDDLVSLYEIVSEQMNPFVGLSKVTKKRLESFETIHKELSELKEKISVIEAGGNFDFDNMVESKVEFESETIEKEEEPLVPIINPSHKIMQNESDSGIDSLYDFDLTDDELNQILEMSFSQIPYENQVDRVIDEYIESLKAR